jgi:hypothetical protein
MTATVAQNAAATSKPAPSINPIEKKPKRSPHIKPCRTSLPPYRSPK